MLEIELLSPEFMELAQQVNEIANEDKENAKQSQTK